jgi:hypothetical protein
MGKNGVNKALANMIDDGGLLYKAPAVDTIQ